MANLSKFAGKIIALLLLGLIVFVPIRGAPVIEISNNTQSILTNVEIAGRGFKNVIIPELSPGQVREVIVSPRGESGLHISFNVNEKRYEQGDLAYIESIMGYYEKLEIDEDF